MARGHKRDTDRARAAARNAKGKDNKKTVDGKTLTPSQRNELDAKRMAEKIARKQEESKVSDSKSSSSDNAEAQRRKAMAANKKTKAAANAKKKKNR